ncbi:hypothetical protein AVEN_36802-1 [Araneus ventricosus]|uniref:Uncharacterized protein n=1 Tax=Araneus ventricosus TaxID=182803 RepID=A0A4Y2GDS6_ARAVE|nr:hypothetical protein AVEN_36802-1 [Araneus ventricosus]
MIHGPCGPNENIECDDFIYKETLPKIKDQVIMITGKDLSSFRMRRWRMADEVSNDLMRELDCDNEELQQRSHEFIPRLKSEQNTVCNRLKVVCFFWMLLMVMRRLAFSVYSPSNSKTQKSCYCSSLLRNTCHAT